MSVSIKVGGQASLKGKSFICTRIETYVKTEFARYASKAYKEMTWGASKNILHQNFTVDDFAEQEIIEITAQVVEFTDPGVDLIYVYPYYHVKKETARNGNDQSGSEIAAECTGEDEVEASRQGSVCEESSGQTPASEDNRTLDGGGSGRAD